MWIQEDAWAAEASPSGAQATWPRLNRGHLEEGRPHKIISRETEDQSEEAYNSTEFQMQNSNFNEIQTKEMSCVNQSVLEVLVQYRTG